MSRLNHTTYPKNLFVIYSYYSHTWCQNVTCRCEFMVSENISPVILVVTRVHHTPTVTYDAMALRGLTRETSYCEKEPYFTAQQIEIGLSFSIMHCMKVPVQKIRSCFTNCVVEFVNHV
jgi:hypothetical protein